MAVALGLMIAAGVINYAHRRLGDQARMRGEQMLLVPADGSGNSAPTAAQLSEELDQDPYTTPLNGQKAPAFTLENLSGQQISLAAYKGRPLVVDFWATWCGPCKLEIPWLEDVQKQYAGQGLQVIGINTDELDRDDPARLFTEKREIGDFVHTMNINYPVLLARDATENAYGGVDSLPTTFFIDRNGTIVASTVGLPSHDELVSDIQKAIGNGAKS